MQNLGIIIATNNAFLCDFPLQYYSYFLPLWFYSTVAIRKKHADDQPPKCNNTSQVIL